MPRVYELPTHLQVEDQLIAGLTARQLLRLLVFASLAFGAWDRLRLLSDEWRITIAAALAVIGALVALVRPAERPLDQWFFAWALFVVMPRRRVWRPGALAQASQRQKHADWADLQVLPAWLPTELDDDESLAAASQPNAFCWFNLCRPWLNQRKRWTA